MPRLYGYYDFSKLEYISTSAAVVFAAEYERVKQLSGNIPPTVNLEEWSDTVFLRLYDLGFFETVGLVESRRDAVEDHGSTRTMRIVSASSADGLQVIDQSLQDLGSFLRPGLLSDEILVPFLTAISEAISNVTAHAYDATFMIPHRHIGRVWVAATADRDGDTLTVVVYDQGTTIPATYPQAQQINRVERFLSKSLKGTRTEPSTEDDGTLIRAAMRFGGSRTGKPYRGKGLPQMHGVLRTVREGRMTVYSRRGWCEVKVSPEMPASSSSTGRMRSGYLNYSIGGTLVEWHVSLSDGQ